MTGKDITEPGFYWMISKTGRDIVKIRPSDSGTGFYMFKFENEYPYSPEGMIWEDCEFVLVADLTQLFSLLESYDRAQERWLGSAVDACEISSRFLEHEDAERKAYESEEALIEEIRQLKRKSR